MNLLSLYSGVGGMDLGAHYAGITTVAFCEAVAWNRAILARHWPGVYAFESDEHVTAESVRSLGVGRIDIVAGGPPCQPFSVAGKRNGTMDERHRWPQMARIVAELRPAFVVVENVAGFADVAQQLVRPDLESIGYDTVRFDIPAAAIGAPHQRDRIFVVGHSTRNDERRAGICEQSRGVSVGGPSSDGEHTAMGDTEERGRRVVRHVAGQALGRAESQCSGCRERCGAEPIRAKFDTPERSGDAVANAARHGGRIEPENARPERERAGLCGESSMEHATESGREGDSGRRLQHGELAARREAGSTESRLGGGVGWPADRVDSIRWPAARGQDQHEWEPPRVTTERRERRKRLKALGNICVSWQAYPVFAAIMASCGKPEAGSE